MPENNPVRAFNPILHAESNTFFWKGKGALSIKTFRHGRAIYQAGRGHFAVGEGSYLLLNQDQEYSITIEAKAPVESFCIFFPEKMAEEVYHSLLASHEQLLDEPGLPKLMSVEFVEKTYGDQWLASTISEIKTVYTNRQVERMWLEERLYELAQGLLETHRQVHTEMSKLQSLKVSTQMELYKRLNIGHEFISAYFDQPIGLGDIAKAACLSTNHFLRSYKQLFGVSPHQYLIEKRLQESKRLLLTTNQSVTDICLQIGFQSPGSFSSLFSRRFSTSPSRFRQNR